MTSIEDRLKRLKLDDDVGKDHHMISGPRVETNGDHATSEVMWAVLPRGADESLSASGQDGTSKNSVCADGVMHQ